MIGPAPRRQRVLVVALLVVVLAVAGWLLRPWERGASAETARPEPVTASVERTTLTSRLRLSAQLTYGDPVELAASEGMLTVLPAAGAVIGLGRQIYESDGRPVVLFRGARPFWRELSEGSSGADVRQLQENLAALGFFKGAVDGRFRTPTAQAVRAWQKSLGLERTGVFSASGVVVATSAEIRIARVTARLGEQGVSPATYTETTVRAMARLTEAQARDLAPGTPVTVVMPDGSEAAATLSATDPGGEPAADGEGTTKPSATIDFPSQDAVAAVRLGGVRVVVDGGESEPTLVVPATALLALAEGGYAVEVLAGGHIVRTPVEIGRVADGRVQVLASGHDLEGGAGPVLAEGDQVVLAR